MLIYVHLAAARSRISACQLHVGLQYQLHVGLQYFLTPPFHVIYAVHCCTLLSVCLRYASANRGGISGACHTVITHISHNGTVSHTYFQRINQLENEQPKMASTMKDIASTMDILATVALEDKSKFVTKDAMSLIEKQMSEIRRLLLSKA